jgi:hypothetical protein
VSERVEELEGRHGAPGAKQQLAAVRRGLFDWLLTGQVVATNPAAARNLSKRCPPECHHRRQVSLILV